MTREMRKMLIIVGIIFGLIFGWYGIKNLIFSYFMSHYQPPPVTVSATKAETSTWQSFLNSVGTLDAVNGVDLSTEVPGIVKEIRFNSGQFVNQGDVLILLDTSVEESQLKDNAAQLQLAQLNYNRYKTLSKNKFVTQADLDTNQAQLQEATANLEGVQAKIKQKTVTAPFSGKIGISSINVGQYVQPGTAMVTLQSLDPLHVQFSLPEQYVPNLYMNQPIEVDINIANNKPIHGKITAINAKVDQSTRTILVEGTIPNPNLTLYPGMFALVKIWLPTKNNVITLPQTAISYSLHGDSVFILKEDGKEKDGKPLLKAYRQYVTVGDHRADQVAIQKGINAGDQVVTSGQLKLQNGTHVVIDNSVDL